MYGIQSQERRYHYSGIAVPVCWNGGAIPAGIFTKTFFTVMENISYQVAAGRIDKDLLHRIIIAVMDGTYETDEELKIDIINAIS